MDITMCSSEKCPMRDTCLRSAGKPNPMGQSWSNFEYTCNDYSGYESYIKLENTNDSFF